jgi:signal transduction histidine kinase
LLGRETKAILQPGNGTGMDNNENQPYTRPVISSTENPEEVLSKAFYELRHPIAAIKGYADLILQERVDCREGVKQIYETAAGIEAGLSEIFEYIRKRSLD